MTFKDMKNNMIEAMKVTDDHNLKGHIITIEECEKMVEEAIQRFIDNPHREGVINAFDHKLLRKEIFGK